jgi:hypothetical protein
MKVSTEIENDVLPEPIVRDFSKFKNSLSVGYILKDGFEYFKESLESSEPIADEIIVVLDSRTSDGVEKYLANLSAGTLRGRLKVIYKKWFYGAETKDYLLKNCTKDYILFLDGDEILSDNAIRLREYIDENKYEFFNIKGHHFINNLSWEDASVKEHFWTLRLVKNNPTLNFTGKNHALLSGADESKQILTISDVKIFHMGYVTHLDKIMVKYNTDSEHHQIHEQDFLDWWKNSHVLGDYPIKEFNLNLLPIVLKNKFKLQDHFSYLYFKDRIKLESKHFIETKQWKDYFKLDDKTKILELGCGAGARLYAFKTFDLIAEGCDIDGWIVKNTPYKTMNLKTCNVINLDTAYPSNTYDFVFAYDLLEHINYEDLDKVLLNIYNVGKKDFLFSIPFKNDPNLYLDSTHKIFEDREWWLKQFKKAGFIIALTPETFVYKDQMVVCEK